MSTLSSPFSHRRLPKALTPDELSALRAVPKNLRDRALIEVMAGCGLRVSEACDLTLDNIHWSTDTPCLRFTGKGGKERVVPMNLEVQDALRAWLEVRGTGGSPYAFCNLRTGQRLNRRTVWFALARYAKRAGTRHVHPHMLRHTFGTSLADRDVPVERIRDLMGHGSIEVSQVYISVSAEQKKASVERLDRRSRLARWFSRQRNRPYRFFGRPRKGLVFSARQTVGRQPELRRLQDNLSRGIDTLLVGPVGVGKSHLLRLLEGERIIRVKGLTPVRQAIIDVAEALHRQGDLDPGVHRGRRDSQDEKGGAEGQQPGAHLQREGLGRTPQPANGEALAGTEGEPSGEGAPAEGDAPGAQKGRGGFEEIKKQHARTSVQGWTQMVLNSVKENDWTLIVDDLSDMSTSTGRLIDRLNAKFILLAALHGVKKPHERHFWKFDRVEVGVLPPEDARKLIRQCAAGADIEDFRMFETYVLQQSAGNPRAIIEIVERLRKEPAITRSAVRDVAHSGARAKIDLTPVVVVLALCLVAARFIARGMGSIDGYMIAGIGSALAIGLRFFLYRFRK